jgi:hypothetical protein
LRSLDLGDRCVVVLHRELSGLDLFDQVVRVPECVGWGNVEVRPAIAVATEHKEQYRTQTQPRSNVWGWRWDKR